MWIQQKRPSSTGSRAVAPGGKDTIIGHNIPIETRGANASGRISIPRLANIAVALNQLILQYLKRIAERE